MRHVIFALTASLVTLLLILVMIALIRYEPPHAPAFEPVTVAPAKLEMPAPLVVDEPPMPIRTPPPLEFTQAPSNWSGVDREVDFGPGPFKIVSRGAIPLVAVEPIYPKKARRDGTTGWVRIQFTINPDGSVSDTYVVEAAPRRGIFDSAALEALVRSRYLPKTLDGVAVPSRAEWTFNFTITGQEEQNVSLWDDS